MLRGWAEAGVGRIVVDGGDGTVRELLGVLPEAYGGREVELAVLPAGKTNALAHDLGVRPAFDVEAALHAGRRLVRAPLEVEREDGAAPVRRGFVLGTGVFTEVIAAAQPLHAAGLFGGLAVGGALATAAARVLLGGASDPWRAGRPVGLATDDGPLDEASRFLVLLTTLERLPLGLRPFGPERSGLKMLDVLAPPRRLVAALPPVLSGREPPWLEPAGYRRSDPHRLRLSTPASFVLDGEAFAGGDLRIQLGAPVTFVVP